MKLAILLASILILVGCGTLEGLHVSADTHSNYTHHYVPNYYGYPGYYNPHHYSYYRPVTVISIHRHRVVPHHEPRHNRKHRHKRH